MLFTILGLCVCVSTFTGGCSYNANNFMDCSGKLSFWQKITKRCCTSLELPKGCECFDVSDQSDFTNTLLFKPQCPEDLAVTFKLYARSNRTGQDIKVGALTSLFDGSKFTKFIIHGFKSNAFKMDYQGMMNALLDKEDLNVILLNWKESAKGPNYYQCAANTRSVGAMTAKLILELHNHKGSPYQSFHLIGHSLGAHVAAMAGKEIQRLTSQSLGRISGLDPAGPCFDDYSANIRLNQNDAVFVDVIHTNADDEEHAGFGIHASSGHVDFYANGGQRQPGCPGETFYTWNLATFVDNIGCSHKRVTKIYKDSIKRCLDLGLSHADDNCPMGYYATPSCTGDIFRNTTQTEPFC